MRTTIYFIELTDKQLKEVYNESKKDGEKYVTPLNLGMTTKQVPAYAYFKYNFRDGSYTGANIIDNSTRYNDDVVIYHDVNYDKEILRYLNAVNNGIIPRLENCEI